MHTEARQNESRWARRLLVGSAAAAGAFLIADAFIDFIPEKSTDLSAGTELVAGAIVLTLAGVGNHILKSEEAKD